MKFKYSAFTENTPQMREWLDKLDFNGLEFFQGKKYLYAAHATRANKNKEWKEPYYATSDNYEELRDVFKYVDCRNSPDLFKAVTAVREDSDYMQWFTDGDLEDGASWFLCNYDKVEKFMHEHDGWDFDGFYKATLEELQEHFKVEH